MSKLITLTSSSTGEELMVNTAQIYKISRPQPRKDDKFADSNTIIEYVYDHPTRPNSRAFDFVKETVAEISAMYNR